MKRILTLTLAMLIALSLSACGGNGGGQAPSGEGDGPSGAITVWYHDYPFEESLKQVIANFNEQYPNIRVDYEIRADGDYYSLLQTAIQSGDGPDLFWTNGTATTTMPDMVSNNMIVDLSDSVDFSFITDNSASALDLARVGEGLYSIPWLTLDTRAAFYNKDLFAEHGWEIPTTFGEFEELLAMIKAEGIIPVSLAYDSWSMLFAYEPILAAYDPVYSAGLSDYTSRADDPAARDALQKMVDWADAGYYGDNWLGVIDNAAQILTFTTGNAAMNIAGSWDAATIAANNPALNLGAFAIPAEDGTTGLVGTSSNGLSVNAASRSLDAALLFANYCAGKEAQTIWVQTQGAVSATPEIEAASEVAREITQSGGGTTYRSWQNVLSSYTSTGQASVVWESDFKKVFTGELTVDQLMDNIAAEMQ